MVKLFHYLFFVLIFMQCNLVSENFHMSKYKRSAVNNLLNSVDKRLCARYGMRCVGSGGAMMYEVEDLSLMFSINRPLSRNQAREIMVDSAEIFLNCINDNVNIKKYLKKYPFSVDDICLSILIYNYDGTSIYHPKLTSVGLVRGELRYHTKDATNRWKYKETIVEPFEDAKRIVEEQKRQVLHD